MPLIRDLSECTSDFSDMSEHHNPMMQLKKISDYDEMKGVFHGLDFDIEVDPLSATKIISALSGLRPTVRIEVDHKMITDKKFVEQVLEFVSE